MVDRSIGTRRILAVWLLTRTALLLFVFKIVVFPGPDVTADVSVIYRGWYEVLRTGTFPLDDVTWQYPPAAALAILSPAVLPFLGYASAFFVLALVCDAAVLGMLLHAGGRGGASRRGAWVWTWGVPLLGPTAYARYDLMVTAVAVAALLAGVRRPRVLGALAAFGALLKVWPVLLLVGVPRGRATRRAWGTAAAVAAGLTLAFVVTMPGALGFLTHQRDRGTEVESLGALVFHVARHFGWEGDVALNYGSVEFLGPHVSLVSTLALLLAVAALGWLVVWRVCVREFGPGTPYDAAFAAVLLFTTTSRVISPQYVLWLVGLAAVCLAFRASRMALPSWLVLAAAGVTVLGFPVWFAHVVSSDALGVSLLLVRNGLLVAATVVACARLWRTTVRADLPSGADSAGDSAPGPASRTPAGVAVAPRACEPDRRIRHQADGSGRSGA
ncbi:glycosyltransferase 87 family protein [Streptomyces sp. NPDC004609]|uniref:glycosyltransferase 87 family protein n=1 Tax=Streptomyces sp. NPDC004609 TaxID=3364704 RepID=UPI0036C77F0A